MEPQQKRENDLKIQEKKVSEDEKDSISKKQSVQFGLKQVKKSITQILSLDNKTGTFLIFRCRTNNGQDYSKVKGRSIHICEHLPSVPEKLDQKWNKQNKEFENASKKNVNHVLVYETSTVRAVLFTEYTLSGLVTQENINQKQSSIFVAHEMLVEALLKKTKHCCFVVISDSEDKTIENCLSHINLGKFVQKNDAFLMIPQDQMSFKKVRQAINSKKGHRQFSKLISNNKIYQIIQQSLAKNDEKLEETFFNPGLLYKGLETVLKFNFIYELWKEKINAIESGNQITNYQSIIDKLQQSLDSIKYLIDNIILIQKLWDKKFKPAFIKLLQEPKKIGQIDLFPYIELSLLMIVSQTKKSKHKFISQERFFENIAQKDGKVLFQTILEPIAVILQVSIDQIQKKSQQKQSQRVETDQQKPALLKKKSSKSPIDYHKYTKQNWKKMIDDSINTFIEFVSSQGRKNRFQNPKTEVQIQLKKFFNRNPQKFSQVLIAVLSFISFNQSEINQISSMSKNSLASNIANALQIEDNNNNLNIHKNTVYPENSTLSTSASNRKNQSSFQSNDNSQKIEHINSFSTVGKNSQISNPNSNSDATNSNQISNFNSNTINLNETESQNNQGIISKDSSAVNISASVSKSNKSRNQKTLSHSKFEKELGLDETHKEDFNFYQPQEKILDLLNENYEQGNTVDDEKPKDLSGLSFLSDV